VTKSFQESRLDRMVIGLGVSALCLVGLLLVARQCGAEAEPAAPLSPQGAQAPPVVVVQEAPPRAAPVLDPAVWTPGANWLLRLPPEVGPGGPLTLPVYPPWTPEQAQQLFLIGPKERYDPLCGKIWSPNARFANPFPEYPGGVVEFVTNGLSLREDAEVRSERPVYRVLVAGDSHTDGVCSNAESFANLCEAALVRRAQKEAAARGQRFEPQWIDVLNAGKGTHSFFSYLGTLQRLLDLDPDVFVVTVYGGNDFEELSWCWHARGFDGSSPPGQANYKKQVRAAQRISPLVLSQALVGLKFFDTYPAEREITVRGAATVMERIQAVCKERGIRLLLLYLPSWPEVEPANPAMKLSAFLQAMELKQAALATPRKMADDFLERMAGLGIETVDLRPILKASKETVYWHADWHINLLGHRLVAGALFEALCLRK
jgi:hypothetical protein